MSENTVMKRVPMDVPFAAEDTARYIFVSYAHDDSKMVFPIIEKLYEMGWHVWYDQGIEINTNYHNVIADHVLGCEVVLLFVSKVSVTRDYVTDTEVGFALDNKKRVVFCFLDESELPSGIRSRVRDTERHPRTTPDGLCKVLESIKELTRVPKRKAKGIRINAQEKGDLAVSNESDEYKSVAMDNGGVRLTEYKGNAENVVVPARWKGRPVVELRMTFWNNKRVKSVTIPDSVTSIGTSVFYGCSSLTAITIPDSVTSICGSAFRGCRSLTAITIPDSVTSIGDYAFRGCSSLTVITIPDSVTSIGDSAFYDCSSLTVECEGNSYAYRYTKKEKIPVRTVKLEKTLKKKKKNTKRTASGKMPFVSDKEAPFVYCSYAHENADIVFPIMKRLHDDGFNIRYDELDRDPYECAGEIRDCAYFLAFLTPAYIDSAISELRHSLPQGRILYWLEACKLPNDMEMNQGCIQGLCGWERTYEDILTTIEATLDKGGCRGRRTAVIPDFEYRADDTGITLLKYTGKSENVVIKSEYSGLPVTSIGWSAFSGCSSLTAITIPDSVTSIGEWAFSDCSSLTAITIPDSVTSIGDSAFRCCTSLTQITIPDSVTSIGDSAFARCTGLISINISDGNKQYKSVNGVLYSIDGTAIIACPGGRYGNFTIPDGVTSIGYSAFDGCASLTQINIPDGVTSIGYSAFSDCTSLTQITIPDSVTSIGDWAFNGCTSLTQITIPDGVTGIGNWAFDRCTSLTQITIPDSVTSIGNSAFERCTSLTQITIPDSVTVIGDSAFRGCTSLTQITIPDSVTSIGDYAFYGCTALTQITIPYGVTSIGYEAFYGCTALTQITIPDSVTSIGKWAFDGCDDLTVYCSENSHAWQYCEENKIKHKPLAAQAPTETAISEEIPAALPETAPAACPETVAEPSAEIPADTPAKSAPTPRKKSPARWLVPLLVLLALAAAAGLQLSGLLDILGLLGL